jgi:hypothetical protein
MMRAPSNGEARAGGTALIQNHSAACETSDCKAVIRHGDALCESRSRKAILQRWEQRN